MPDDVSPSRRTPRASARNGRSVPWTQLRQRLQDAGLLGAVRFGEEAPRPNHVQVDHLADDSRKVRVGGGFIAVRGTEADGHAFIDNAIQNGAQLVVCEALPDDARARFPQTLFVRVTNTRRALAELAAEFYGNPADELRVVGVTGTNGKTTVAFLVHHMLDALDEPTGLLSTVEVRTGVVATNATLTTPGPLELHRTFRRMVDDGCTTCAMEVSSHALDQERVHTVDYGVAVFTNLTSDHLDYHESAADYRNAKKRLFDGLAGEATAIVNADDEAAPAMVEDTRAQIMTYGLRTIADVPVRVLESTIDELRLNIDGHERSFRLAGRFNAYNLAAAYGTGRALGYDAEAVLDALSEAPPVPGRFETLRFGDGTTVVVDYAHTPDALENILQAIAATADADATLWCVFGCGGDRDRSKRRVMGTVAEYYADRLLVTSDNPRSEEPEHIMNDIRRGMDRPGEAQWIVDREAAIRAAAEQCAPGDVVLIAGKGHETYQTIGTEKRAFDDRKVAQTYFGAQH
jgi:UDP-N-acetylmuramoyl-L-alanyl-D-glutamate--2,6-diaminopimelate ligase